MRVLLQWTIRLLLLIVLLVFAAMNMEPATMRFYFGVEVRWPLVVLLFAFFASGALLGMLAMAGRLYRQRQEILRLRREARQSAPAGMERPPRVDA